ncbi:BCCT family transporter [Paramixta manurensis]|uniref:BCCT family transporter n=1 Tax=Paramixta manurensis TaxID=2740817 RepID=A0A6M8UJP4_9GAMM|nr:BCCT family transporter [Erwiniaceae bacterium PD-1]
MPGSQERLTIQSVKLNRAVFFGAALIILLFSGSVLFFPHRASELLGKALNWASASFGWYYMLVVAFYLGFVLFVALSRYGDIKLGPDHATPDFSYGTWAAMLFSAGIGSELLFYGASEPLDHLLQPPDGVAGSAQAARDGMVLTMMHWGLHGWGIYTLVAMALAYFAYRHNLPLALRSAFYPLIGERINGPIGHAVDIFGIVGTLFGLATSLGIGVMQINSGISFLTGIAQSHLMQVVLIIVVMGAATLSAVSGVDKGIRRMSEINMLLALLMFAFVLFAGPTGHLLNTLVQNFGDYFTSLPRKTFDLYAYSQGDKDSWLGSWTVFYWAWWIAWSPFVGMFIARISRGRTLREFVIGVLLIPMGFTLAWLSVFGNSALNLFQNGMGKLGDIALGEPAMAVYHMLASYPLATPVIILAVVICFIFFVTSADSGALVVANLSCVGDTASQDAPNWLRIFWAAAVCMLTLSLLFAGDYTSLQTAVVLSALPFSLVLVLFVIAMYRALHHEKQRDRSRSLAIASPLLNDRYRPGHTSSWRRRLNRAISYPTRDMVYRFMEESVRPALEKVSQVLHEKGLHVENDFSTQDFTLRLRVAHGEEAPFHYAVQMSGYATPSFMRGGNLSHTASRYYRAEVHLWEGSQEYDLVGYTEEQIINDILDHYERHLQFLHLIR